MTKGLFSILRRSSPRIDEKDISMEDFQERTFAINRKLSLLPPEQIKRFFGDLIDIMKLEKRCIKYGAKDPVNLPPSDVVVIKENLYERFYSS